jgi:hypothetical protein
MIISAIILGGIISTYVVGGLFVKKDGATQPTIHWAWPATILRKIKKAI